MSARDFARVLLKVTGLLLMATFLAMLPGLVGAALSPLVGSFESQNKTLLIATVGNSLTILALGLFLLLKTEFVLSIFFRDLSDGGGATLNTFSFQAVAFSVIGAYVLVFAISELVSTAMVLFDLSRAGQEMARVGYLNQNKIQLLSLATRTVIGVFLFLGGRNLAAFWHKVQPIRDRNRVRT